MTVGQRLNYGHLMQKAMRQMMADVLSQVAEHGLPGEHHFYISFETDHPGVDIPDWLRETYPDEMTIVLQEWFADLAVASDRFSVTLTFSAQAQTPSVPLDAVRTLVDPSVTFRLKFDAQEAEGDDDAEPFVADTPESDDDVEEKPAAGADVVSLDEFRKH
mgnify:FL=1